MTEQGHSMDAFEKFYADNLDKADVDGVVVLGKEANRQVGYELLSKVQQVRRFEFRGCIVTGNRAFVVWYIDIDHADFGPIVFNQVAIQDWENGKIVKERFYM